ncbi:MAG: hypothetical protein HY898_19765 [Deltaproteobacteria bacterium]|nr:hypothetical protein [Deltaproteobacteria bacterium]
MRSTRQIGFIAACGLASGAAAWVVFASLPATRVLVGTRAIDAVVPVHYQVTVFPAFGAYCAALAMDVARRERARVIGRALLVAAVVALAVVRLAGQVGLSGHAVCCAAVAVESLASRQRSEWVLVVLLAMAGLAVTGWYKLWIWGDPVWFVVSVATGAAIGLACGPQALVSVRKPR